MIYPVKIFCMQDSIGMQIKKEHKTNCSYVRIVTFEDRILLLLTNMDFT